MLGGSEDLAILFRHDQGNQIYALGQLDATDTTGQTAHHTHLGLMETHSLAVARHQHDVFVALGNRHVHQMLAFLQFHRNQTGAARTGEVGQGGPFDDTAGGSHENKGPGDRFGHRFHVALHFTIGFIVNRVDHVIRINNLFFFATGFLLAHHFRVQTQNGGNALFIAQCRQQIDNRFAARCPATLGQLKGTQPEHLARIGKQQQGVVGAGYQQVFHIIFVFQLPGGFAATTTLLGAIGVDGLHLGVTTVGQGHHHGFFGDQVFHAEVLTGRYDLGTTLVGVFFTYRLQFFANHFHQALGVTEDLQQFSDLLQQFLIVIDQLFAFQAGQLLQTQVQNRLGLFRTQVIKAIHQAILFIQAIRASRVFTTGTLQHLQYIAGLPALVQQLGLRFGATGGGFDQLDNRIDVAQGNRQAFQQVGLFTGLAQFEHGAACHHFPAVADKGIQQLAQVEDLRLTIYQCHGIDTEHRFHLGLLVQVIEHHLGIFATAQLNHHAHPFFIRFVAQLGDAFNFLVFHQLGDLLNQPRLVHLIRDLGDDDGFFTALVGGFDFGAGAHVHTATASTVGLHDTGAAIDDAGGGEIRALDVFHQVVRGQAVVVDQREAAIYHFAQVVGRDIGGHAHGNTGRAVHQQVGHPGGHHIGNLFRAVVVIDEIHGFLVQIRQQLVGNLGHAHFGVTHGSGGVPIDGTKVTLTIHQHVAQGKRLRHPHDGVIYRGITVGVVFTNHVTDHTGRFLVGLVPVVAQLVHGKQHTAVHRLEAIAHVGQRPPDDYAHGVIQV